MASRLLIGVVNDRFNGCFFLFISLQFITIFVWDLKLILIINYEQKINSVEKNNIKVTCKHVWW